MTNLIIKNGLVFDPLNEINGEIKDILIENGKIVDSFSNMTDIKEINAKGMTVIPAAIDIHAHVASQQVNWARLLGKKDMIFQETWKGLTLENIARNYVSNGYTTIIEANVFPSLAKQTIFNFNYLPVLDKAMLLNVSNLWPLELEYQKAKMDDMSIFLSDLLKKTKAFGFKIYNPFESENWDFKILREDLSDQGRLYNFNALNVYEALTRCNEHLSLPHSVHAHIEGYETEQGQKNLYEVLEYVKKLDLKSSIRRSQIFHLAHASSYNVNGDNSRLIKFYNDNQLFDMDLGFVGFNKINSLITSDRRIINSLINTGNPYRLIRSAIEFEGDLFATFRVFDKNNERDCILWANAIDLALNIKNKYQIQASINFPNYANISDIPEIASFLISKEARTNYIDQMNGAVKNTLLLSENTPSLSFNEFIIITRVSPAKSLGLAKIKGNLGINAEGDVNILNINPNDTDLNKNQEALKRSLKFIEFVIKGGNIIKKQEKIDLNLDGRIFWTEGHPPNDPSGFVMTKKKEFYQKFNSNFYDSLDFLIDHKYLMKID